MRIGLGTAQFGFDYGVSNRTGQVPAAEVGRILALAASEGVRTIDTAAAYGGAEARFGELLATDHPFSIVTKIPPCPAGLEGAAAIERWAHESVTASLTRLRASRLHGLLAHRATDLLGPEGDDIWRALEGLRQRGVVDVIGASIYSAQDLAALLERFPLRLVQLPVNVFDQRLVHDGHLARLKVLDIEVHARSVFLQGVLLMDPDDLPPHLVTARKPLAAFRAAAAAVGRTPLQAAIGYVQGLAEVDTAVVGVTTSEELAEILAANAAAWPSDWFAPFALDDAAILDPSRWPA
ncbi:MAG: aldo/keto reductase [Candidatus Limnocylindrales bacterium]